MNLRELPCSSLAAFYAPQLKMFWWDYLWLTGWNLSSTPIPVKKYAQECINTNFRQLIRMNVFRYLQATTGMISDIGANIYYHQNAIIWQSQWKTSPIGLDSECPVHADRVVHIKCVTVINWSRWLQKIQAIRTRHTIPKKEIRPMLQLSASRNSYQAVIPTSVHLPAK